MKKTILSASFLLLTAATVFTATSCNQKAEKEEKYDSFYASTMIRNEQLWNGKSIGDEAFDFIVEYNNDSVTEEGFGESYNQFGHDILHDNISVGEWGNVITRFEDTNSAHGTVQTYFVGENAPKTREEALEKILAFLDNYGSETDNDLYAVFNGHYPWQHYGGMTGRFGINGVELGENMENYKMLIAMTRGAARQYNQSWFVDFSSWFGTKILDYKGSDGLWGENGLVTGGHSMSLMERTLLLSYMSGADATIAEAGEYLVHYPDGSVSPYGEVCRKLYKFTSEYTDKGTAYTPFAVVLDRYHGIANSIDSLIFNNFEPGIRDDMTADFINNIMWQDGFQEQTNDETCMLADGRYGDAFDFLLEDASADVLSSYPVLILMGDIQLSDTELQSYKTYLENGGIIVMNTAYAEMFSKLGYDIPSEISRENGEKKSFEIIKCGNGEVYLYGKGGSTDRITYSDGMSYSTVCGNYHLGGITSALDALAEKYIPFVFTDENGNVTEASYSLSVSDGKLLLTVMNNDGVNKTPPAEAVIDENELLTLTVEYTGGYEILSVCDVYNGNEINLEGNKITFELTAGDIAVIEIKLGGNM